MSDPIEQLTMKVLLGGDNYLIPMYQRNYAWGEAEITQLIQDVLDEVSRSQKGKGAPKPYYIGSLVVDLRNDSSGRPVYEVIDGQQRLTTLFLLASCLRDTCTSLVDFGWFSERSIDFQSRPRSTAALEAIFLGRIQSQLPHLEDSEKYNVDIVKGYMLVQRQLDRLLKEGGCSRDAFADYLFRQVVIMRVKVPEKTDLNHYFEIMNNRGEQLEKHEVLKSRILEKIQDKAGSEDDNRALRACVNQIWQACANMERYVQMGFSKDMRDALFGRQDWGRFVHADFDGVFKSLTCQNGNESSVSVKLMDIIGRPSKPSDGGKGDISETPERFSSVVNFPNFLLQVLRVTTERDVPLDDKRLIDAFEEHLLQLPDSEEKVKQFVYDLLKCKYLYDHYILKREFASGKDAWSLKRLIWRESSKGSDYVNTFGEEEGETSGNRQVLMLLSAMHVSVPSMAYKHWLNAALRYLYQSDEVTLGGYTDYLEGIARCFVYDRFMSKNQGMSYYDIIYCNNGNVRAKNWDDINQNLLTFSDIQNNFVFNYLDYLLWKDSRHEADIGNYSFTFRSSVEHYYPQNPLSDERLEESVLNSFGNLCLISHSKNSRLSNHSPQSKKEHYQKGQIDSPKQWLMMQLDKWGEAEIRQHDDAMIQFFRKDLEKGVNAE